MLNDAPRRELARLGLAPSKDRGQNFLRDKNIVAKIALEAGRLAESAAGILEIGPGLGALTGPLLDLGKKLWAVEYDRGLAANLAARPEADEGRLTVLNQDILDFDPVPLAAEAGGALLICGNLPYNISSPILLWLVAGREAAKAALFMLQKEMAERLAARPGSKDYGRLSVAVSLWFTPEKFIDVPASAFQPKPKVESSVIRLIPRPREEWPAVSPEILGRFTAAAFAARRKTILNNLAAAYGKERALEALEKTGVPSGCRPETIAAETLADLAKLLS